MYRVPRQKLSERVSGKVSHIVLLLAYCKCGYFCIVEIFRSFCKLKKSRKTPLLKNTASQVSYDHNDLFQKNEQNSGNNPFTKCQHYDFAKISTHEDNPLPVYLSDSGLTVRVTFVAIVNYTKFEIFI